MDDDGGGMDGGITGGEMIGMTGTGMGQTEGESRDSAESVLESMGYRDSGAGTDENDEDSTGPWASTLQTVVILAVVGFLGISFVYFLLTGLLALFGVHI